MTDTQIVTEIHRLLDAWNPDADEDTYYLVRDIEELLGRPRKP